MRFRFILIYSVLLILVASLSVSASYTNLAVGKSYTYNYVPSGSFPDTGMLEMTDGILPTFGSSNCWVDGKTAMWQTSPTIYLNLGGEHEIQNVTLYSCRGTPIGDAGVYEPAFVEFYGSNDNSSWVLLANVTSSSSGKFEADNIYKTKKYLKIYSRAQGEWLPIGEVQILASDPVNFPAVINPINLVSNKTYSYNIAPDYGGYPDTNMQEMTNGILPTYGSGLCWSDGNSAIWSNNPIVYMHTIPVSNLKNMTVYTCRGAYNGDAGIAIPSVVDFYGSYDNSTWVDMGRSLIESVGKFSIDASNNNYTYFKINAHNGGGGIALGEVKIFGDELTTTTTTTTSTTTTTTSTTTTIPVYINLALGKSYSYSVAPNMDYSDPAGVFQTDGILPIFGVSTSCWDKYNTPMFLSSDVSFYMDLHSVDNISNMSAFSCHGMYNGFAGVYLPSVVRFYGSIDNSTWINIGNDSTGILGVYSSNNINKDFRYVKITLVSGGSYLPLGEVEVFGKTLKSPESSILMTSQVYWYVAETVAHSIRYGIYNSSIACDQTHLFYVNGVAGIDNKVNTSTDKYGVFKCQNSTQGAITVVNDGSVSLSINSSFSNMPSGVTMKFGHDNNAWQSSCDGYCNNTGCDLSSKCLMVNISSVRIAYSIPQNGSKEYWMWADFNKVAGTVDPIKGNMTTVASMTV